MKIKFPYYSTKVKTLSLHEYMSLSQEEKDRIKSERIIPPKLGEKGFGKIEVTYKSPVYELIKVTI